MSTNQGKPDHAKRFNQAMAVTFPAPGGMRLLAGKVDDHVAELFPRELEEVARTVPRRQYEFATGRMLARRCMGALGLDAAPVLRGEASEPRWPDIVTGSLTHAGDLAVATLAPAHALRSVGIDLEVVARAEENLYGKLFTPWQEAVISSTRPAVAALMFSAKKGAYKLTFPLARRFIDFHEVETDVDLGRGGFRLHYVGEHPANQVMECGEGYFLFCDGYVLSLVSIASGP